MIDESRVIVRVYPSQGEREPLIPIREGPDRDLSGRRVPGLVLERGLSCMVCLSRASPRSIVEAEILMRGG